MYYVSASCHDQEEPFEARAEREAQMIRNLLPDEDDLFSGVFNELEFGSDAKGGDGTEDYDLFSSIGGMELERDNHTSSSVGNQKLDYTGGVSNFRGKSTDLVDGTNKLGPILIGGSNHCLMRRCREMEKDGAVLYKRADDILPSQNIYDSAGQNVLSDSSRTLNSFPSLLNISPVGDHFGLPIPSHRMDLVKFGGQYISSSEPRSFPDRENNLNYIIPNESQSNAVNIAGLASDMENMMHISVSANRMPMESQGGIISPFGNATCPVHGHPWSNCYLLHQTSVGHNVWPNSPSFSNIIKVPSPPQNSGFPAYCSGSFGNMSPLSSLPFHPIARGSPILDHPIRSCTIASNDVMNFSPPTAHSLGSHGEMWRNLSRRKNQGCYINANKRGFELDLERILRGEDVRTTLMLKNIPNKYSSKMLLATIDEQCKGIYDFVYLPIDFKNNCNVGYAFINLIDPLQIVPFYNTFNGKKWEKFNSEKVAALAYARIQGKAALISHFQNSSLMNEDKRCRPVLFCTKGPNAGEQEPFPSGNNIRVKAARARRSVYEDNHRYHGSLSPKSVITQEA